MVAVAVAGGLGDFGRVIVHALLHSGKYTVYSLTRKIPADVEPIIDPEGNIYIPAIQIDYEDETQMTKVLDKLRIHTIISALGVHFEDVSQSQIRLIHAAAKSDSVKRFIPSEYNVDYDLGDNILPYKGKSYFTAARRALEETDLQYTYIFTGMFMDFFGLPRLETHLRPVYITLDLEHNEAAIVGDGSAVMCTILTTDAARYIAAVLDLENWPKKLVLFASNTTTTELVDIAQRISGRKLEIWHNSMESTLAGTGRELTGNISSAAEFNSVGNSEDLLSLAGLSASVGLGAYDLEKVPEAVNLVTLLGEKISSPTTLEAFLKRYWGSD